mmetsp:Transcript_62678/g.99550  ORF Transcript_62678/g.99550 Transcript_62678/m.99550 type:complete len:315 (+) Transcript_62678:16-960(+)
MSHCHSIEYNNYSSKDTQNKHTLCQTEKFERTKPATSLLFLFYLCSGLPLLSSVLAIISVISRQKRFCRVVLFIRGIPASDNRGGVLFVICILLIVHVNGGKLNSQWHGQIAFALSLPQFVIILLVNLSDFLRCHILKLDLHSLLLRFCNRRRINQHILVLMIRILLILIASLIIAVFLVIGDISSFILQSAKRKYCIQLHLILRLRLPDISHCHIVFQRCDIKILFIFYFRCHRRVSHMLFRSDCRGDWHRQQGLVSLPPAFPLLLQNLFLRLQHRRRLVLDQRRCNLHCIRMNMNRRAILLRFGTRCIVLRL